jgi:hypothetical protein
MQNERKNNAKTGEYIEFIELETRPLSPAIEQQRPKFTPIAKPSPVRDAVGEFFAKVPSVDASAAASVVAMVVAGIVRTCFWGCVVVLWAIGKALGIIATFLRSLLGGAHGAHTEYEEPTHGAHGAHTVNVSVNVDVKVGE